MTWTEAGGVLIELYTTMSDFEALHALTTGRGARAERSRSIERR